MPVSWPRARDSSARTPQLGRMSPGREALGRTRCRRPSGWVTVPSFSAWVSSGKTTSAFAVVAFSKVEKTTRWSAAVRARSQAAVSGKSRRGSTPKRIRDLSSPDSRAARISSVSLPGAACAEARAGVGEAAGLAQAAGVGWRRGSQAGRCRPCRRGRARRRRRAGRPSTPRPRGRSARPRSTTTRSASWRTSADVGAPSERFAREEEEFRAPALQRHFDELRVRRGCRQRPRARRGRRWRSPGA